jgi:hypothetical protein
LLRSCHMRWRMRCMHRYSFEKNSFPCRSPNVKGQVTRSTKLGRF